jgi:integrase
MKSSRPRDIPLSGAAVALLTGLPRVNDFVFPANRRGKTVDGVYHQFAGHLFDDAMGLLLRELGGQSTVHGTRAMFRSWVTDHALSVQDHDAAELALDHEIGNKVTRAYDRSDTIMQRRDLGERWSQFLIG